MKYAPILVTVYTRLDHLRKCIDSLKSCPESKESILYVASDDAATQEDEQAVNEVRRYLRGLDGFKEVVLILREENLGGYNNSQDAKRTVFSKHDRMIRLEDDVIVGKGFLYFINQGLDVYEGTSNIVGVCGYLPPGIYNEESNPFFLDRRAPYGFGVWRDKETIFSENWNSLTLRSYFSSFKFFRKYEHKSPHVARALPLIFNGELTFGDIIIGIIMQANNLLALYPPKSITKSMGNDGSGLHSGFDSVLQNQIISDECFSVPTNLTINVNSKIENIISRYRRFFGLKILNYMIYFSNICFPKTYPLYKFFRKNVKQVLRLLASNDV